jgi:hypothetical protein
MKTVFTVGLGYLYQIGNGDNAIKTLILKIRTTSVQ